MRLGELRHRLLLEQPREGALDGHGQPPEGWDPVAELYAQITPLSGKELELARQVEGRVTHEITIRFNREVTPRMRLVKGARAFNIASVRNEDERDDVMVLLAYETVL